MFENKSQNIAYIGNKPVKKDTAGGTATIWNGFGDIQEVLHGAAVKLLQHPEVWITEKQFNQQFPNELTARVVGGAGLGLSSVSLALAILDAQPEETTGDKNSSESGSGNTESNSKSIPAESNLDCESSSKTGEQKSCETSEKATAIQTAILSLEPGNSEHFSEATGAPLLNAVRTAANDETISVKDLNAVWKALNKAK